MPLICIYFETRWIRRNIFIMGQEMRRTKWKKTVVELENTLQIKLKLFETYFKGTINSSLFFALHFMPNIF